MFPHQQQATNGPSPFSRQDGGPPAPATTTSAAAATEEDEDTPDALEAPLFRSVAVQPHFNAAFAFRSNPFGKKKPAAYGQVQGQIKSSFQFSGATLPAGGEGKLKSPPGQESVLKQWQALAQDQMYVLPCYYPKCERRSATTKQSVEDLLERLYACFKKLSIQARHESSFATFGLVLRTTEQSELSLLIWYANKKKSALYVEVDKRQSGGGCGGSFPFQYICRILKVVKASKEEMASKEDSVTMPQHRELQAGFSAKADRCRKMDLVVGACAPQTPDVTSEAKPSAVSTMASFSCVGDQTVSSLEMAWGLLQKSVTWSHGLELLGTVSDPDKSGIESSKVASKAILLGAAPSPRGDICCRGIHTKLTGLMQSLVGNSTEGGEISTEHLSTYQKDCLLQLVLTCLVNAMEVHVKFVRDGTGVDVTMSSSVPEGSSVMSQFLESTKDIVACDIIETLMDIIRRANTKPHHAYLAVKALFLLSSENSNMRQCVSVAMSREDTQREVLQQAHEVGAQTHGLLEAECERLRRLLSSRH